MPKNLFIFFFFALAFTAPAQVTESFSDGDFIHNPTWFGTDSLFKVNSTFQLQSAGKLSLTPAFLSIPFPSLDSMEWEFWLRFAFNPSSQNQVRFYLYADSSNLSVSRNAVYLQFGGSTGTTDSLNAMQIKNGQTSYLIQGKAGTLGQTNNIVKVKLTLSAQKILSLWLDTSIQKNNYQLQGQTNLILNQNNASTGIWFKYTIGNAANVYFDDLYIGNIRTDTLAPKLLKTLVDNDSTLRLVFSEPIDTQLFNYSFKPFTDAITLVQTEKTILNLKVKLKPNTNYQLAINNLCDAIGNCQKDTLLNVMYVEPIQHQVLFTELMPDPSPSAGLPEAEYIEIYNQSQYPIPLYTLNIADENKAYPVNTNPNIYIAPQSFLILCNKADSALLSPFGKVQTTTLPTLSNDGKTLYLRNQKNDTIHAYSYNLKSYQSAEKSNGGYALEMIHPSRICMQAFNWKASGHALGGTPGQENFYWQMGPDTLAPKLKSISFIGLNQLQCTFSESIDSLKKLEQTFFINQKPMNVWQVNDTIFKLTSNFNLEHQKTYQINLSNIKDCSNNALQVDTSLVYYEVKAPQFLDLLINEVCFDENRASYYPAKDYIELKNRSKFACNLGQVMLCIGKTCINLPEKILLPDSLILLFKEDQVNSFSELSNVMPVFNFPSLNLNETITLFNTQQDILHQVSYQNQWLVNQLPFNPKAASIELILGNNVCSSSEMWQASLSPKGGSPGKENTHHKIFEDTNIPHLKMACALNDSSIILRFNESMHPKSFFIHQPIDSNRLTLLPYQNSLSNFILFTPQKLPITIELKGATDCAGHPITAEKIHLLQPKSAVAGDIKFTEILFDAYPNQSDFIELHNTTDTTVSLDNLLLIRKSNDDNTWKEVINLYGPGHCLAPHQTLALHPNPTILAKSYSHHQIKNIYEHNMLNLPLEGGFIALRDSQNTCIDSAYYSEKMHFELLVQTKGISLERQQLFPLDQSSHNWFSSATDASPGVFHPKSLNQGPQLFSASPAVFSPNLDGQNDVITFSIKSLATLAWAKPIILNQDGKVVYQMDATLFDAFHHTFTWTGVDMEGNLCQPGIYIAILQTQDNQNQRATYRCSFAIAATQH